MNYICGKSNNSSLFIHTMCFVQKQENIRGADIRIISTLPVWLSILEKLSLNYIKNLIKNKLKIIQLEFIERGAKT